MLRKIKINIIFYYISILLIVISVFSMISFLEMGNAVDVILKENMKSVEASEKMIYFLTNLELLLFDFDSDIEKPDGIYVEKYFKNFEENLTKALNNITVDDEKHILSTIEEKYGLYKKSYFLILSENSFEKNVITNLNSDFNALTDSILELSNINKQAIIRASKTAKDMAKSRSLWMIFLSLIGFLSVFFFNKIIREKYQNPLDEMVKILKRINFGEKHLRLSIREGGLGEVSNLVNRLIENLNKDNYDYINYSTNQRNILMMVLDNFNKPVMIFNNKYELIISNIHTRALLYKKENRNLMNIIKKSIEMNDYEVSLLDEKKYQIEVIELNDQNLSSVGYFVSLNETFVSKKSNKEE